MKCLSGAHINVYKKKKNFFKKNVDKNSDIMVFLVIFLQLKVRIMK